MGRKSAFSSNVTGQKKKKKLWKSEVSGRKAVLCKLMSCERQMWERGELGGESHVPEGYVDQYLR